jgi:hypothetical protein
VETLFSKSPDHAMIGEVEIIGPSTVYEEEIAVFSLSTASEDVVIHWSVEPPTAGVFGTPNFPEVGFYATDIPGENDIEAEIRIDVSIGDEDPVTKSQSLWIYNRAERDSWRRQWEAVNSSDFCIDSENNIYVTGGALEGFDLDPGPEVCILGAPDNSHISENYIYLSKFSPEGAFLWSRQWGGAESGYESERGFSIDTDSMGNVFVLGSFAGICDFDPGPDVVQHESYKVNDRISGSNFLSCFDKDGNFKWVRILHGRQYSEDSFALIDNDDNITCVGSFCLKAVNAYMPDGDPAVVDNMEFGTSLNDEKWLLAKFNNDGVTLWCTEPSDAQRLSGTQHISAAGIDINGNIYITGHLEGEVDLDPGDGVDLHRSNVTQRNCLFLTSFNPDGTYRWGRSWDYESDTGSVNQMVLSVGNSIIYLSGSLYGVMISNDSQWRLESSLNDVGNYHSTGFMIAINHDGDDIWGVQFCDTECSGPQDIHFSPPGSIFCCGEFRHIDLSVSEHPLDSATSRGDLIRLSDDGIINWVGSYDQTTQLLNGTIESDTDGNVYLLGFDQFNRKMSLMKFAHNEYWFE